MARKVTQLPTRTKRDTTSRDVLLLSNKDTSKNFQIPITEVFPKLNSGSVTSNSSNSTVASLANPTKLFVGGGVADTSTGIDNNTLIYRGFRIDVAGSATAPTNGAGINHNSTTCPIALYTETRSGVENAENVLLAWDASNYGLSNFDNDSAFLTSVSLATNVVGVLPVDNGGTGLSTVAQGSVLISQTADELTAVAPTGDGKVLISNGTTGYPAWSTLTAGTNVTITEGAGSITIASSIGTISSTLDLDNNNIDLGSGWLSGDGTNEGINIDGDGRVFVGSGTSYFTNELNVNGSVSLGTSTGSSAVTISAKPCTSGVSQTLTITGSTASGTNNKGGDTYLGAGHGDGAGDGGNLYLRSGRKGTTGTDGDIYLQRGGVTQVTVDEDVTLAAAVDLVLTEGDATLTDGDLTLTSGDATLTDGDVTLTDGNVIVTAATKGLVHTGRGSVTQATDHTTGVTINATSGVITLAGVALNAEAEAEFTVTNSTVNVNSLILLTVVCPVASSATDNGTMVAQISQLTSGAFKIRLTNPGAGNTSTNTHKINFLVINNSV